MPLKCPLVCRSPSQEREVPDNRVRTLEAPSSICFFVVGFCPPHPQKSRSVVSQDAGSGLVTVCGLFWSADGCGLGRKSTRCWSCKVRMPRRLASRSEWTSGAARWPSRPSMPNSAWCAGRRRSRLAVRLDLHSSTVTDQSRIGRLS